jgi:hypothetical protein
MAVCKWLWHCFRQGETKVCQFAFDKKYSHLINGRITREQAVHLSQEYFSGAAISDLPKQYRRCMFIA